MDEKQLPKLSSYRWVILAIAAGLDAVSNYIQFQVSTLAVQIMPSLHISPAQLQSLGMAPMLIAVFLSIPAGSLADKFGPKKIVSIGLIISIIGSFGRLIATNFASMMIMLLLFGVYMALLNANTLKLFGTWFKQDTNIAMGVFFASASVGIILTRITSPMYPSLKSAYTVSSFILLLLAVSWMLFVKDTPKGEEVPQSQIQQGKSESTIEFFKAAARSKKTWIVAISVGIGMGASEAFSTIMPTAFAARGMSSVAGNSVAAIATVGSLCGSLFGPAIIGKAKKAKPLMIMATLLAGFLMAITWFIPLGAPLTIGLVVGGLLGATTGPLMQALPITFPEIGPKYAGSAGGLIGTVSLLFSYCVPVIISMIAGRNYMLTFIIQGIVMMLTSIFMAILPDANAGKNSHK